MNRMKSMELLKLLQPFTQTGVLKGSEVQTIVSSFIAGNIDPLKKAIYSPSVPLSLTQCAKNIEAFIAKGGNQK